MKKAMYLIVLLSAAVSNRGAAQNAPIFPKGEIATVDNHTGTVWLNELTGPDSIFNYSIAMATFAPGAKLDWHIHPAGQILLITDGTGYYQEKGKPIQIVHKGNVIKCLPGVEHWHGAAPTSGFAYIATTPAQKGKTIWLKRVTTGINTEQEMPSKKILIIYLSRTNNTKAIAEIIHTNIGGTLVALELEKPYPENYQDTVQQVVKENESGYLPPLRTKIDSMQSYDIVFVGFPTWDMKMPPPMKSFLKQYNLSGKTIIPFNTNAGYGVGSGFQTVKELCPNSTVLKGFSIQGGVERDGIIFVIKGEKAKEADTEVKRWLSATLHK